METFDINRIILRAKNHANKVLQQRYVLQHAHLGGFAIIIITPSTNNRHRVHPCADIKMHSNYLSDNFLAARSILLANGLRL